MLQPAHLCTSWESDITTSSLLLLRRLHINSLKLKQGQTANVEPPPQNGSLVMLLLLTHQTDAI